VVEHLGCRWPEDDGRLPSFGILDADCRHGAEAISIAQVRATVRATRATD
jgi:hypothetical protein